MKNKQMKDIDARNEKKFHAKYTKMENGCWNWIAAKDRHGYGVFRVRGWLGLAHRLSYEYFIGPIPEGLFVCHVCANRSCVNPEHLVTGTHKQNMKDRFKTGIVNQYSSPEHSLFKDFNYR